MPSLRRGVVPVRSRGPLAQARMAGFAQVPIAGVSLIALLLIVAAGNIIAGRALETWDSLVRHELEQELIYRGEQYKFAIEQFYAVNRRPPRSFEELCPESSANRRFIRRCWDDPMTGEPFHRVRQGQIGQRRKLEEEVEEEEDDSLLGGFGNRRTRKGDGFSDGPSLSDVRYSLPGSESRTEEDEEAEFPFIGVASDLAYDAERKAFAEYEGIDVYRWWEFVAEVQQQVARGARSRGPRRGGSGQDTGSTNTPDTPNAPNAPK